MGLDHRRLSPRAALQQELLGEETKLIQDGAAETCERVTKSISV